MAYVKDIAGQRFGRLVAVERAEDPRPVKRCKRGNWWRCACDCGGETIAPTNTLVVGDKTSCGCDDARFVRDELLPGILFNRRAYEDCLYPDPNSGCILYVGSCYEFGHGRVSVVRNGSRKLFLAHRVAWILSGRELPPRPLLLRHKCNTPCCCNVDHLIPGTQKDNILDAAVAERTKRGQLPRGVERLESGRFRGRIQSRTAEFRRHVGTFDTIEEAAEAVRVARAQMFKDRGVKLLFPVP